MKSIEFVDILTRPGRIEAGFREINEGKAKEDRFYISFDRFLPSDDTIALVLASFCGQAYDKIYMDLSPCRDTFDNLKQWTKADLTVRNKKEEDYHFASPPLGIRLKGLLKRGEPFGKKIILNYSGGLDSLALLCCVPANTHLCSIYFEGFERERDYFKKFRPYCASTDVRKKIPIDQNDWEFMGFASILYKEYLGADYLLFGTIAESWSGHLDRHESAKWVNPLFLSAGLGMPYCTHSLTELGTAIIVGHYMPDELASSLESLAPAGSEKLFRKECLVNIACEKLGLEPAAAEYHEPKNKMEFGQVFATDFLSLCIAKYFGIQYAEKLYTELPPGFERFVEDHSLSFYSKIKQDNQSKEPNELIRFFCGRAEKAGLEYYSEEDYRELKETMEYLRGQPHKW